MRLAIAYVLALFVTALQAGEELAEQELKEKEDTRIVEYEQNIQVTTEGEKKVMPQQLQESPVRMIVGGDSEDGVARKIIVAPR